MECDKLKPLVFSIYDLAYVDERAVEKNFENPHDHAVYKATEVDALLAEKDKEIESLKASHYAEMVDAGMRERRLKRALYKACANWAIMRACILEYFRTILNAKKWERMYHMCRAKAEEYK